MRLILSRKGFDSTAGGCPSPILPDGRLCSLPIPDPRSPIDYQSLNHDELNLGGLVRDLTNSQYQPRHTAHLDPDVNPRLLLRDPHWRAMLGQTGAAQGHLLRQKVGPGDLFLFFGLYREVDFTDGRWAFVRNSPARHILWGWLQVDQVVRIDDLESGELPWARYHPHFYYGPDPNNTLYIARQQLQIKGIKTGLPGAGTFTHLHHKLVLTAPEARLTSTWRLPAFFHPVTGSQLSYHYAHKRWTNEGDSCLLQSAARGQEFVLTGADKMYLSYWLNQLFELGISPYN